MAKFKDYDYRQGKLIPVYFEDQVLPGTFEYALNQIVNKHLDLSVFDQRYNNDKTGAPAFDPAILLKIILYAYSHGITSSRKIEWCCRSNIVFKALSADTVPHFTTISNFISSMSMEISSLFSDVLLMCDEMGLIGKSMFAIDGCKLPSNASKEWSGTREDFKKKQKKLKKTMKYILNKHRLEDKSDHQFSSMKKDDEKCLENLQKKVDKIKAWLTANDDKIGKSGKPIKSNITDNESAKMKTSHGVIQGYNGVAAVDSKHQVIVQAEAFGAAQEHDLLEPMVKGTRKNFEEIGHKKDIFKKAVITADNGFHTEANLKMLDREKIEGYLPDNKFRKRDPRFVTAERHKKGIESRKKYYTPSDFKFDLKKLKCICPAGKAMILKNRNHVVDGLRGITFMGWKSECRVCSLRKKCLRKDHTEFRQVTFFQDKLSSQEESYTHKMIKKIETVKGRFIYSKRMGTVEPVFANICSTRGLQRFSLRGKVKVNTQWLLYCLVHNIGKLQRFAPQIV